MGEKELSQDEDSTNDSERDKQHDVYVVSLPDSTRGSKWGSIIPAKCRIFADAENMPFIQTQGDEVRQNYSEVGLFMSGSSASQDLEEFCSSGEEVLDKFVNAADLGSQSQFQHSQKPEAWVEDTNFDDPAHPRAKVLTCLPSHLLQILDTKVIIWKCESHPLRPSIKADMIAEVKRKRRDKRASTPGVSQP